MVATLHKSDPSNSLFVKFIWTTDAGIYGAGEGSLQYKDLEVTAEMKDFPKFLIGKAPFAIEYIWTSLYRITSLKSEICSAMPGIKIALHPKVSQNALSVPINCDH